MRFLGHRPAHQVVRSARKDFMRLPLRFSVSSCSFLRMSRRGARAVNDPREEWDDAISPGTRPTAREDTGQLTCKNYR